MFFSPSTHQRVAVWLILANLDILDIGVTGHVGYLMSPAAAAAAASRAAKVAAQL